MFRPFYFKENDCKLVLMKNRHEELIDIDININTVDSVVFSVEEPATMTIEVPSHIDRGMTKIDNPVFNLVKGKMQLILTINKDKYKFIIESINESETKDGAIKTLTCYEWQYVLGKVNCIINEAVITRQLYRGDNQLEVGEGVLDLFVRDCKGWSVARIDQKARQELTMTATSQKINLFENLTINEVKVNTTDSPDNWLFDKNVDINIGEKPLNMTISWNATVYDTNGKVYINATNEHNFSNLPYAIKNIKAEYIVTPRYPYGIKYIITYINDTIEEFSFAFINCKGLKLVAKTVNVVYELGDFAENWVTKYRNFQAQSCSWLTMLSQIEETFDCIITFDSYNQSVSVYDKSSFGKETGLYLSYNNALKEITKEKKIEDIVTRLVVESSNTSIASVNPLGTEYIESFKYFQKAGIMSDELSYAMEQYDKLLVLKDTEFNTIKLDLYAKNQQVTLATGRLTSLENKLVAENAILASYIKFKNDAPDNEKDTWSKKQAEQQAIVTDIENQSAQAKKELEQLNKEADTLQKSLTQIGIDIKKENAVFNGQKLFSEALLLELSDYIIESSLSDEVYLTSNALYNHAKKTLEDMQSVVVDFTVADANVDFLDRLRTPNGFGDFIFLGAKVDIEDRSGELSGTDGKVILYGFTYNPKLNKITDLQFVNNKEKPVSALKAIGTISQTVSATKSITDFYKATWEKTRDQVVDIGDLLTHGLDLSAQKIRSRTSKNIIDMTEAGIFLIDANNTDNQLGMINDLICMTDDKWKTSRIAISPEGIMADYLIGRVILGQELYISNGDFGFLVRDNGLTIRDKVGSDKIFLGLDNGEPNFKLGMNKEQDHLMWENGELSIRAKKINIGADDVITSTSLSIEVGKIQALIKDTEQSLQTSITQTANAIRLEVTDVKNGLESNITQTASAIRTELKDTKNDLQSSITQTANLIRAEVSDVKTGLESTISQTASAIRLEVGTVDSNLKTLISQTKSDIQLLVEDNVKSLQSSIKVESDRITTTVGTVNSLNNRVDNAESKVTQLSNEISSKVSVGQISSLIQQNGHSVMVSINNSRSSMGVGIDSSGLNGYNNGVVTFRLTEGKFHAYNSTNGRHMGYFGTNGDDLRANLFGTNTFSVYSDDRALLFRARYIRDANYGNATLDMCGGINFIHKPGQDTGVNQILLGNHDLSNEYGMHNMSIRCWNSLGFQDNYGLTHMFFRCRTGDIVMKGTVYQRASTPPRAYRLSMDEDDLYFSGYTQKDVIDSILELNSSVVVNSEGDFSMRLLPNKNDLTMTKLGNEASFDQSTLIAGLVETVKYLDKKISNLENKGQESKYE